MSSALGLTFPSLLAKVTPTGAFCLYAGLNMLSFLVIFFVVPETKQRTLEELDVVFSVSTSRHASYQSKVWLPYSDFGEGVDRVKSEVSVPFVYLLV